MKYENYAEALGFEKKGKIYVMEANGFTIYLRNWQYVFLSIPSFYIPLNKPLTKEELKKMEKASYDNAVASHSLGEEMDTLVVTLSDGVKTKAFTQQKIKAQIEGVTKKLIEDGYGPRVVCPICKEETPYKSFGSHYCPMHEGCQEKYVAKLKELSESDKGIKKGHILSLVLSFLGVILGILPAFFLAFFNGDFFSFLMALVPILAILGFFLGKAPAKKGYKLYTGLLVWITLISFLLFAIPYMANQKDVSLYEYMFTDGWVGFRKAILGFVLSFGGFGGMKFLDKSRVNYDKELKTFED